MAETDKLEHERKHFKAQIASAIEHDEDPLAAYDQFIQWTVRTYGEKDPNSGLLELLQEVTRRFRDDPSYKNDLRYLKIWILYSWQVDKPTTVFSFLMTNDIGITFAGLYEEYAAALERSGMIKEAENIYRVGIKRKARPVDRLKNKYQEFQSRISSGSALTQVAPLSNTAVQPQKPAPPQPAQKSSIILSGPSTNVSSKHGHNRYAYMLEPPVPGKRPEKLRLNLSLLFTEDGVEYSMPEARARSMGLLGKKWGPPPESTRVNFNDGTTQNSSRRRSVWIGGPEPTVTINTKEALADVFGMFNSPEKTRVMPGSKHAPLKKVDPVTPGSSLRTPSAPLLTHLRNENMIANMNTPTPGFKPFVDENAKRDVGTPAPPPKLIPFVDPESSKASFITPTISRQVLASKDGERTSRSAFKPKIISEETSGNVFKVFTPAAAKPEKRPRLDIFVDEPEQEDEPPQSELVNVFKSSAPVLDTQAIFTPFVDSNAQTPFKVFSRPPQESGSENAYTPKPTFTPFRDTREAETARTPAPLAPSTTFTPFVDHVEEYEAPSTDSDSQTQSLNEEEIQAIEEQAPSELSSCEDDFIYDQPEPPLKPIDGNEPYSPPQEAPMGGRFGQFNVMTPISERTLEYTMSARGSPIPYDQNGAAETAELLVAELQADSPMLTDDQGRRESLRPFRLSEGHTINISHDEEESEEEVEEDACIEDRTGGLSIADVLTITGAFRPPNPCNPFKPSMMSDLLSRLTPDSQFFDLRTRETGLLETLRKFAKRHRKTSGNTSSGAGADVGARYPINLSGQKFLVSEQLGEGGFGSVFKATGPSHDGIRSDPEVDDDDDEEDDETKQLAIKIVKPRNLWEYHALRLLHAALPAHLRRSVIKPHALYAFKDESFLILDLCPQGTLLNVVNNAVSAGVSQQGGCLDELLVVFFAVELLRLVEGMHGVGFIHGDLKIDNCLLRLEDVPGGASSWTARYEPSGEGGWTCKGLCLIDFGRAVDTRLFPPGQTFIADWDVDERDCLEMREGRPWTYQTDYFGLAGIIYCMLFGKYIQESAITMVRSDSGESRFKLTTPFKRYWQGELWERLFDLLLNPCLARVDQRLPIREELRVVREDLECWLQGNCNRSTITLKGLLKKVEVSAMRV